MSRRVLVLVEGPTERGIIQSCLAPEFGNKGIELSPRIVGKPGKKAGVKRPFEFVMRELRALAK